MNLESPSNNESMKTKWYGVYTRPNCEKKVSDLLTRKGIENYFPCRLTKSKWNFQRKTLLEPLFPSYVFMKVEESQLETLKNLSGVINFLFWIGQPVVIQDSEIDIMKSVSSENLDIKIQKTKINFQKIHEGPKVSSVEIDGVKTFKVTLRSIGYHLITQIESPKLTIISALQNNYKISHETEFIS